MALGNLFKLAKLTIEAYEDSARSTAVGLQNKIEVQYNPETLSVKHESVFQHKQGIATSSAQARFSHSRSKVLNVALVLDGTNVGYFGVELLLHVPTVAERIQQFLELCYDTQSESHEPSYLKLTWAKGVLGPSFDCRLQSVDIKYTAFDRDGSPLHAELAAVFVEDLDPKKKASADRLASPDLTHRRVVRSGDTLPLLCREIYGSAHHYLRVAEVNRLDDFRELRPGQELIFPPFEQGGGS
jgi:Contractile injection system tube protein